MARLSRITELKNENMQLRRLLTEVCIESITVHPELLGRVLKALEPGKLSFEDDTDCD